MLSPSSIPSMRARRAPSICSLDSGYGPGNEDAKFGIFLEPRDATSALSQQSHSQTGLGIDRGSDFQFEADSIIKQEDFLFQPSTPHLRVCTAFSNPSSPEPVSPGSPSDVRRSHARKSTSKLPAQAIRLLHAWLDENQHHPYPSAEAKQTLAEACNITIKQVTTWFTNIRQRQLKSRDNDAREVSNGLGHITRQTSRKGKKKDYSRSTGASPVEGFLSPPRLSPSASVSDFSSAEGDNWQCTFCRQSLTAKSWRRHEETQHHPKHQWTCLGTGPRIQLPSSLSSICAFCELEDPDEEHFHRFHRIGECSIKAENDRTFGRPDHLQQHAKNFHKCEQPLTELVRDAWRMDRPGMIENTSWTCGFCQEVLLTWDARATHIAGHFKAGLTMAQWRDHRVSQTTLFNEYTNSESRMELDNLGRMGMTMPGPSNQYLAQNDNMYSNPAQTLTSESNHTATLMSSTTSGPPYFDVGSSFLCYGSQVDTFVPAMDQPAGLHPSVNIMSTAPQNNDIAMDFDFIEFDQFGNSVYSHGTYNSW